GRSARWRWPAAATRRTAIAPRRCWRRSPPSSERVLLEELVLGGAVPGELHVLVAALDAVVALAQERLVDEPVAVAVGDVVLGVDLAQEDDDAPPLVLVQREALRSRAVVAGHELGL